MKKIQLLSFLVMSFCSTLHAQKFTQTSISPFNKPNFHSTVIDYNNDGLDDVIGWIVDTPNSARLYKNNGNSTFTDVSVSMNFPSLSQGGSSLACKDLNKDGLMDLYYQSGDTLRIFFNNGNSFSTATNTCGIFYLSSIFGTALSNIGQVTFFDYNGDGIYDILAWINNGTTSSIVAKKGQLFCGNCGFGFSSQSINTLVTFNNTYGTNFQLADVDNDGDFDLLISQTNGDGHFVNSTYAIYVNNNGVFTLNNNSGFISGRSYAFGQLGEFNNDGITDIFSGAEDCCLGSNPLSTFFSTSTGGVYNSLTSAMPRTTSTYYTGSNIVDIDLDKKQDVLWNIYAYYGNSALQCLINNGNNTFTDNAASLGIQLGTPPTTVDNSNQTTTIIDINNDKKPDINILDNNTYSLAFYNNYVLLNTTTNNGIKLKLSACTGLKEGWGARIKYKTGGSWNYQEHTAYASSNYPFLYLGMGTANTIDSLIVYWIGGATTVKTNILAGSYLVVQENANCTVSTGITGYNPLQDTVRACGDSTVLNAGAGYSKYSWSNGATTPSITVKQSGSYRVSVTNASGCTAIDSSFISIVKANIINKDTTITKGSNVTLAVQDTKTIKVFSSVMYLPNSTKYIIDTTKWHYIALTKSGSIGCFYFDGTLVTSSSFINNPYIWNSLLLAATQACVSCTPVPDYNGIIDEVRVSNIARAGTDIINSYNSNSPFASDGNTIGLFHLDSISAGLTHNTVGTSANLFGNPYLTNGKFGMGMKFNGITDYARWSNSIPTNNMTLEFWYKSSDSTGILAMLEYAYNTGIYLGNTTINNSIKWSTGDSSNSITVTPTKTTTYYLTVTDGVTVCKDSVKITVASSTPVVLGTFDVNAKGKNAEINWNTKTEINCSYFDVQRSLNGIDFATIRKMNTKATGYYSIIDLNIPQNQVIYYRLEIVDKDGSKTYSEVRQISTNKGQFTISPNPVKNILTVWGEHISKVQVIDNSGRTIKVLSLNDATNPSLQISNLSNGVYHLHIQTTDNRIGNLDFVKQ